MNLLLQINWCIFIISVSGAPGGKPSSLADPTLATFLDVAVLRCLFVHQWMEEGVYWALNFVYRR